MNPDNHAFPHRAGVGTEQGVMGSTKGMTLRDWFAGQALVGNLANEGWVADYDRTAEWCYLQADACIRARDCNTSGDVA